MTFLIDGYNLMFAVGLARQDMLAPQFDRARGRFLDWLAVAAGRAEIRVIFDAYGAPSPSLATLHRGVRVRFAFKQTADDLIEELIAEEPRPATLRVVSNDGRISEAARRGGCVAQTCEEFVDWHLTGERETTSPGSPDAEEKPRPSADEVAELLDAFSRPKPKP